MPEFPEAGVYMYSVARPLEEDVLWFTFWFFLQGKCSTGQVDQNWFSTGWRKRRIKTSSSSAPRCMYFNSRLSTFLRKLLYQWFWNKLEVIVCTLINVMWHLISRFDLINYLAYVWWDLIWIPVDSNLRLFILPVTQAKEVKMQTIPTTKITTSLTRRSMSQIWPLFVSHKNVPKRESIIRPNLRHILLTVFEWMARPSIHTFLPCCPTWFAEKIRLKSDLWSKSVWKLIFYQTVRKTWPLLNPPATV